MLRLTGVVIHGQGKGGPAGFPTANLCRDAGEALPENGVYAALARLEDGKTYLGVTNVGTRPTADDSARVTIETLLIGYAGDLYGRRMTLDIVGFTEIQEAIRDNCKEEYFTIIMRRFMMRIAERIGLDHGAKCLVTGENLGQVASQTMDAMAVTGAVVNVPIFHPLIGMDKEEIVTIARKIGTMETSILPYEDCCTVFTPRHPKTKPVLALVEAEEAKLDVEALIARAIENTEKVAIRFDDEV